MSLEDRTSPRADRVVLVVEDGREYTESFTRLATPRFGPVRFHRAGNLAEARAALGSENPHAIFLDVVFDRTPEADLAGDLEGLIGRFGGDRARSVRHLAENQGFYLLDLLWPVLGGIPVVLAYDFSAEPGRFEALRERVPHLAGLPDGASITRALELLLGPGIVR